MPQHCTGVADYLILQTTEIQKSRGWSIFSDSDTFFQELGKQDLLVHWFSFLLFLEKGDLSSSPQKYILIYRAISSAFLWLNKNSCSE